MFCYGKHAVLQAPCRSLITGQSGLLHICRNCGFASYKLLPQKYNRLGKAASIDKAVKIIQEYVDTLKLNEYLFKFRESKWKYDYEFRPTIKPKYDYRPSVMNISPNVDTENSRKDGKCFAHNVTGLFFDSQTKLLRRYKVFLRYFDGGLYVSNLFIKDFAQGKDDEGNAIWNVLSKDEHHDISNLKKLEECGEWLCERLGPLVKLPTPEIIMQ